MNGMNPCITLNTEVVVWFFIFQFFSIQNFYLAGCTRFASIGKAQGLKFSFDLQGRQKWTTNLPLRIKVRIRTEIDEYFFLKGNRRISGFLRAHNQLPPFVQVPLCISWIQTYNSFVTSRFDQEIVIQPQTSIICFHSPLCTK